jgi:parallel beta-helix repeat protein
MSISIAPPPRQPNLPYSYVIWVSGSIYYAEDQLGVRTQTDGFSNLIDIIDGKISTSGGSVFIRAGIYSDLSGAYFDSPVDVVGAGRGKTVIKKTIANSSLATMTLRAANSTINSLTIDGDYPTNTTANNEIELVADNQLVYDVEVKKFANAAIVAFASGTSVINSVIKECVIVGPGVSGFGTYGIYYSSSGQRVFISNTVFGGISQNAIHAGGTSIISNCYLSGNSTTDFAQIDAGSAAEQTIVENCTIERDYSGGHGIEIKNGRWIVRGNRINRSSKHGIVSTIASSGIVITDNVVRNCGLDGIHIENQSYVTIEGNRCHDDRVSGSRTQRYGIAMYSGDNYVVKNNSCYLNLSGQVTVTGAGLNTIVVDNLMVSGNTPTVGPNLTNFISGNVSTLVATNSGFFGPRGYIIINVSGNNVKVPYFT